MVIQAGGARTVMDARARACRGGIALGRARRSRGVGGDAAVARSSRRGRALRELAPQPGIEDLDELIARSRARPGSERDRSASAGEPIAVPPGLSLCAYRVVQEALTNTIKHAGAARAEVSVRWHPRCARVRGRRRRPAGRPRDRRRLRRSRAHRHARARGAAWRPGRGRTGPGRRLCGARPDPAGSGWPGMMPLGAASTGWVVDVARSHACCAVDLVLEAAFASGVPAVTAV